MNRILIAIIALLVGVGVGTLGNAAVEYALKDHGHPELPQWKGAPSDKVYNVTEIHRIICDIIEPGESAGGHSCPTAVPTRPPLYDCLRNPQPGSTYAAALAAWRAAEAAWLKAQQDFSVSAPSGGVHDHAAHQRAQQAYSAARTTYYSAQSACYQNPPTATATPSPTATATATSAPSGQQATPAPAPTAPAPSAPTPDLR